MDLENWITKVQNGQQLSEDEFKRLCEYVKEILKGEPKPRHVSSPVTVCRVIHGQFHNLKSLFQTRGLVLDKNYIFLGDSVHGSYCTLEAITTLLLLKARYPDNITLLRGYQYHESSHLPQVTGFYDECQRKYGNANAWRYCADVFEHLTVTAIIDGTIQVERICDTPQVRVHDENWMEIKKRG